MTRAQCSNCGAPAQECGVSCFYCGVMVEKAASKYEDITQLAELDPKLAYSMLQLRVLKPPAEVPAELSPPRWVRE